MTDKEVEKLKVGDKVMIILTVKKEKDRDGFFRCTAGDDDFVFRTNILKYGEKVGQND